MRPDATKPNYPPNELSDQALAWIVRLHSGEAKKTDWTAFGTWRRQSADHEAAAHEAEMLWSDASELHRDPVTGLIRPGRGSRPSRRAVLGGVAGLAVVGATGFWAIRPHWAGRSDYSTGVAETRIIDFPDGSRVTLNAMSEIDIAYTNEIRRVVLIKGQGFFEVRSDRTRPFIVDVRGNLVGALGTAFDIDANLPEESTAVAVTEHSVRVDTRAKGASASDGGESIVVSEGERVVIFGDGHLSPVGRQDAAVATAWQTGMYVAEERRLEDVIAAFSAYHEGWIVVQGEDVKSLRVNAVLDLRTPDASLDALANGLPIRVRHLSRYLVLVSGA